MAATRRKTGEVIASARKELEAQLGAVREEQARLAAEELALTQGLASLDGGSSSAASDASTGSRPGRSRASRRQGSTRKPTGRRRRGASTPTAARVEELRLLLAERPRSRADLAAALKVSPARVQQLLAELGSVVSSQPDPNERRGKLWTLNGDGDRASAKGTTTKPATSRAERPSQRKSSASRKQTAK